jgi:hypothetical protein
MSLLLAHIYWKHANGPLNLAEMIVREEIPFPIEV